MDQPHVAILGGGSAAFAGAIRAVEGGARVTIIDAADVIGGTCVNTGCVPSKILIRAAHLCHQAMHHSVKGLGQTVLALDNAARVAQQQATVETLRQAKYQHVIDTHPGIRLVRGRARFLNPHALSITSRDGTETVLSADRYLIATGAESLIPDIPGLDDTPYWTSTQLLETDTVPGRLAVLGGSAVAVELAQAFARLGSQVTIIARSTLLSRQDPLLGAGLREAFETEDLRVLTHADVKSVTHANDEFGIVLSSGTLTVDRLVVATGRAPNTRDLQLARAGVATGARGAILVDDFLQTSAAHIYAAGDCTDRPQFVYVAAAAGTRAAINMLGGNAALDLATLPAVVFTDPQVASVGLTETGARARGIETESRTLPLEQVPRALANFDTRGFIKLVAEQRTGRLLGAQILAPEAGEMIQSAALALRAHLTVHDLADQLFPYLTMVEGLKLCAQTFTRDVTQLSCCAG